MTGERNARRKAGERDDERHEARDPLDPGAPLLRNRVTGEEARGDADEQRTGNKAEREDPPVVHPRRPRLPVLRDSRQRQRDPERTCPRAAAERDRGKALHAVTVEQDPRSGRETRERDAESRIGEEHSDDEHVEQRDTGRAAATAEPQRKRHPGRADERELVPVAERRAQAREAAVVGVKRGHAFRKKGPRGGAADEERRALGEPLARHQAPDDNADERERRVDERAVRERPGAIRRDRPDRAQACPDGEPGQTPEKHGRGAIDADRREAGEDGGQCERARSNPHERRIDIREAATEEHGAKTDRRSSERCPATADAFARSAHRR